MDSIWIVLAVADPVDARRIVSHLESRGYAVDLASDAEHAIALAATRLYKLLVLDIQMPISGGGEAMTRLHLVTGQPLKVIAIAAEWSDSSRAELERMGVDGYLTKPIDLKALDRELNRVLDGHRR